MNILVINDIIDIRELKNNNFKNKMLL